MIGRQPGRRDTLRLAMGLVGAAAAAGIVDKVGAQQTGQVR